MVVNDNSFWALLARRRRDVTSHDRQGRRFVDTILKERAVPRVPGQSISLGPVPINRRLGVFCRHYTIRVHIVRVDPDYQPKCTWVTGLDRYPQRSEIEPLLVQAVQHYAANATAAR
jgi:hypothetical protein